LISSADLFAVCSGTNLFLIRPLPLFSHGSDLFHWFHFLETINRALWLSRAGIRHGIIAGAGDNENCFIPVRLRP
jgi:hypothetical protein